MDEVFNLNVHRAQGKSPLSKKVAKNNILNKQTGPRVKP